MESETQIIKINQYKEHKTGIQNNEIFLTVANLYTNNEYNIQSVTQDFSTIKIQNMEYGECTPLKDKEFYMLLNTDSKGQTNPKMVEVALKYFPELSKFSKGENPNYINFQQSIDELLTRCSLPEFQFS